ncbi:MAG: hypothetical protein CMK07_16875 [Ponticaulis sp.]|nr:hypothetical protein [Ponticaulis sp.]
MMNFIRQLAVCFLVSAIVGTAYSEPRGEQFYECRILSELMLQDDGSLEENHWLNAYQENDADIFTFDEASGVMRWKGSSNEVRRWEVLQKSSGYQSTIASREKLLANIEGLHIQGWLDASEVPFIWTDQVVIRTGLCAKA